MIQQPERLDKTTQSERDGQRRRIEWIDRLTCSSQDSWLRRVLGSKHGDFALHVVAHEQMRRAVGHAELSIILREAPQSNLW